MDHQTIAPPGISRYLSSLICFKGPLVVKDHRTRWQGWRKFINRGRRRATINVLPDDVLIDIFDLCLDKPRVLFVERIRTWQKLAHVSRRWRNLVFQSPRRLNLQLLCTINTPVRRMLDIWPALPMFVLVGYCPPTWNLENVTSALKKRDRISQIAIGCPSSSQIESFLPIMQEPFPALTSLNLTLYGPVALHTRIPDSFLGGHAPHLRRLSLENVAFPALPALLLSATDLVTLSLQGVPRPGYISPEAMVACLFALTRLESLKLGFRSSESCPGLRSQHLPSPTRVFLPALTWFEFKGVSEYLEVLVARIDAPLLNYFEINFFNQAIFYTPHLSQFIGRVPNFRAANNTRMVFSGGEISIRVPSPTQTLGRKLLTIGISRMNLNSFWWPSSLAQLYTSCSPFFLTVEHLYMRLPPANWQYIAHSEWLEILHPLSAVKNLYLSQRIALCIAPALQELAFDGKVTEVLPALQNIFLAEYPPSEPVRKAIGLFTCGRWLLGQPVAVFQWDIEKNMRREVDDG